SQAAAEVKPKSQASPVIGKGRGGWGGDGSASGGHPWWWLFDAQDSDVELVCVELLNLYEEEKVRKTAGAPLQGEGGGGEGQGAAVSPPTDDGGASGNGSGEIR
ncbi:unnamed protein product, partial [Discosporangium mesarthrocarpum]